jgi:rhamnogalacturonan endolyase
MNNRSILRTGIAALACLLSLASTSALLAANEVSLTINGKPAQVGNMKPDEIQALVIDNGLLKITFGKDVNGDFSGTSVIKNGVELAHNLHGIVPRDVDGGRTFYLDSGAGRSHLQADLIKVYKNTPQMAHFAVTDNRIGQVEHHFVMMQGQSGIYAYVVIKNARPGTVAQAAPAEAPATAAAGRGGRGGRGGGAGTSVVNGETRTMYRFDRDILDHAWNIERGGGVQPKYADLVKMEGLQDETWRLPSGEVYQKYDWCAYYAESPMWGHYGHGLGVFFMPVSTEYYAGGPLRQELIIHQDALILNYIGGGHFGGGGGPTGRNGQKIDGPWYLYFAANPDENAMIKDALSVAEQEKAKWPYQWVEEGDLYPTKRTKVTGQLKITDGRSPAKAWIILAQPGDDIYRQSGDYIFYTRADDSGKFTLNAVRPGAYTLYAWGTQDSITEEFARDNVEVKGDTLDLGTVSWTPAKHNNMLWNIGKADRMSGEYKFGDQLRTMMFVDKVPANLTYTIGKSNYKEDWYYAQTQVGNWDINFDLPKTYSGNAYLTIAIAGGGGNGEGGGRGGRGGAGRGGRGGRGGADAAPPPNVAGQVAPEPQPEPGGRANREGRVADPGANAIGPVVVVSVNGQELTPHIAPGNDSSTYRAALRSGVYKQQIYTFPASQLKQGPNTIRLNMTAKGGRWNGIMYDAIVLEAD